MEDGGMKDGGGREGGKKGTIFFNRSPRLPCLLCIMSSFFPWSNNFKCSVICFYYTEYITIHTGIWMGDCALFGLFHLLICCHNKQLMQRVTNFWSWHINLGHKFSTNIFEWHLHSMCIFHHPVGMVRHLMQDVHTGMLGTAAHSDSFPCPCHMMISQDKPCYYWEASCDCSEEVLNFYCRW